MSVVLTGKEMVINLRHNRAVWHRPPTAVMELSDDCDYAVVVDNDHSLSVAAAAGVDSGEPWVVSIHYCNSYNHD